MSLSTSRSLAGLALAVGLAGCTDTKSIDTPIPGRQALRADRAESGLLAVGADRSPRASPTSASTFDRVRVIVRNNPDTTAVVVDTTIAFGPTSSSLTLDLTVPGRRQTASCSTRACNTSGTSGVLYSGAVLVKSHAAG